MISNLQNRSFSIVVSALADAATSSVELRDTAGTLLTCNYIEVCSEEGIFHAYPSGVYAGALVPNTIAANTSGAPGGVGNKYNPVILSLAIEDATQAITVGNYSGAAADICITYGNVQKKNMVQANRKDYVTIGG